VMVKKLSVVRRRIYGTNGKSRELKTGYTPFTRYSWLSIRLYNRFDSRLYRINKHPTGCQTGLTIGYIV